MRSILKAIVVVICVCYVIVETFSSEEKWQNKFFSTGRTASNQKHTRFMPWLSYDKSA